MRSSVPRVAKLRSSARFAQSSMSRPGVPGIVLGRPIPIFMLMYLLCHCASDTPIKIPAALGGDSPHGERELARGLHLAEHRPTITAAASLNPGSLTPMTL